GSVWITTSTPQPREVLMPHRNAPLAWEGRLRLARCVVDDDWPLRRAAERFQVSVTCAARWAGRYRACGEDGLFDRSSRPHHHPRRTPTRRERPVITLRVTRRWGPVRIASLLGMAASTVHRILTRYGLPRLARRGHRDPHPAQAHPPLPATNQRQGRTLQPHPARRMG